MIQNTKRLRKAMFFENSEPFYPEIEEHVLFVMLAMTAVRTAKPYDRIKTRRMLKSEIKRGFKERRPL
jgi:hypothetical protein